MRAGVLAAAVLLSACDPFHTQFDGHESAVLYEASRQSPVPDLNGTLTVMTWNIKFAGGRIRFFWDCDGTRGNMSATEVRANLSALGEKIRQVNPDILLIQEADALAKRCAYIDNVQELLDQTDLNYAAYASQWKADYIPSDGLGRMDSGNAILSRWPLLDAERIALPLVGEQDALTRYFYLKRNILKARIAVPGFDNLWAFNVHAEAFSKDGTKLRQIERLKAELDIVDAAGGLFIAGGDLNSLPPGSPQRSSFADDCQGGRYSGDDYTGEETWLDELYAAYTPAVGLGDYAANPDVYFTFSGDESVPWTRTLDYLFTNGSFEANATITHQDAAQGGLETLSRSDHAPVSAQWVVP